MTVLDLLVAADDFHPAPDQARGWAQEELAKAAYGKSALQRAGEAIVDWLADLLRPLGGPGPVGTGAVSPLLVLLLLAVVAGLIWLIATRTRRTKSTRTKAAPVFEAPREKASAYRARADAALAAGRAAEAVIEGYRAACARLIERHVVDDTRDRTVRDYAAAAELAFPDHADAARLAAHIADATLYGGARPGAEQARTVLALDDAVAAGRPRRVDPAELPAPLAVPR